MNFVLAAVAILMVPPGTQLGSLFSERLKNATGMYNLTDKLTTPPSSNVQPEELVAQITRKTRELENSNGTPPGGVNMKPSQPLTRAEATRIWDALQSRGCCGYQNATLEWQSGLPKSCCAEPITIDNGSKVVCKDIDQQHAKPCLYLIESTSLNLLIVLALIALVNLYLATVFGVNTYRTFHYNEANQNAYT